jgi:hypothetical protein
MSQVLRTYRTGISTALIILLCFIANGARAQRVEIGLTGGLSTYIGDISPIPLVTEVYPGGGPFIRLNMSTSFAWTNSLFITRLTGSDKNFSYNRSRNIEFRTDLIEASSVLEFNFLKYGTGVLDERASSYIFAGLSLFYYNPKFYYGDGWSSTRGKQTEGSRYSEYAMGIPFGIGYKVQLNRNMNFECQFGFRKTFTDYLDDVSTTYANSAAQYAKGHKVGYFTDPSAPDAEGHITDKSGLRRGNPDFNDWYIIAGVSLSYRLYGRMKCGRFY